MKYINSANKDSEQEGNHKFIIIKVKCEILLQKLNPVSQISTSNCLMLPQP